MRKIGLLATGLSETLSQAAPSPLVESCRRIALARSRTSRAEPLKSAVAGSSTVRYKSGRRNFKTLFDSTITFSADAIFRRKAGIASANRPCSVRTHKARVAPASRNRDVSDAPDRSFSSEMAQLWSAVAQSHAAPSAEQMPWRYWVIFTAVHCNSCNPEIRPSTTLVFPTLRECPPITTIAMDRL